MLGPLRRAAVLAAALAGIGIVIWVDVTTPVWQNLVIVSGLVAGAVTFLFTTLFVDRFLRRAARRRWAPVTRLALTGILHEISDEDAEAATAGRTEPPRLPVPDATAEAGDLQEATADLRRAVVVERDRLSAALVTWWNLLTSIPDTEEIIRHTADAALLFDGVRDASLEVDRALTGGADEATRRAATDRLRAQILTCNHSLTGIVDEISARLAADRAGLSEKAQQTLDGMRGQVASA